MHKHFSFKSFVKKKNLNLFECLKIRQNVAMK
jgi:hypothetical protein